MTYCFGYQHGGSIFLFADTVATLNGIKNEAQSTSFGQLYAPKSGTAFSESTLKLVAATDSCLVAFAGAIRSALNAVGILQGALNTGSSPQDALDILRASISGAVSPRFELLVAFLHNGTLEKYHWDSESATPSVCPSDGLWTIGTPVEAIDQRVQWGAQKLRASPLDDQSILIAMCATFQAATNHALTVANGVGVGGIVLGARIDSAGIHWLGDTNYVMYNELAGGADLIQFRRRESGFALTSPRLKHAAFCVQNCEPNNWISRWQEEIVQSLFLKMAKNWVFLHDLNFGGFMICSDTPFNSCATFDTNPKTRGLHGIAMLESLKRLLIEVVRRPEAGLFVIANPSNSLGVVAHALLVLTGTPVEETTKHPLTAIGLPLRSVGWTRKPPQAATPAANALQGPPR